MKFVNFHNCEYSPLVDLCDSSFDTSFFYDIVSDSVFSDVDEAEDRMMDDPENITEEEGELHNFYELILANIFNKHYNIKYKSREELDKKAIKEFEKIVKMLDIDKIEYKPSEDEPALSIRKMEMKDFFE